jgi:hypothetical protein
MVRQVAAGELFAELPAPAPVRLPGAMLDHAALVGSAGAGEVEGCAVTTEVRSLGDRR